MTLENRDWVDNARIWVQFSIWNVIVHALFGDGQIDYMGGPYSMRGYIHVNDLMLNALLRVCCTEVSQGIK